MLEVAFNKKMEDPYIIDSLGWGMYLTGRYEEAEKLLQKAVKLMPLDPIVNDHYADILWKLNKNFINAAEFIEPPPSPALCGLFFLT